MVHESIDRERPKRTPVHVGASSTNVSTFHIFHQKLSTSWTILLCRFHDDILKKRSCQTKIIIASAKNITNIWHGCTLVHLIDFAEQLLAHSADCVYFAAWGGLRGQGHRENRKAAYKTNLGDLIESLDL